MGFDFSEACRECVWLRSISQHIQETNEIANQKGRRKFLKIIRRGSLHSKKDITRVKYIHPRFFSYIRKLEKNKEVDIEYVRSCDNSDWLVHKSSSGYNISKTRLVSECGICVTCDEKGRSTILMRRLQQCTLFFLSWFLSQFPWLGF